LSGIQKKVSTVQGNRKRLRVAADPDVARSSDDETFTHDELRARLARDSWIVETPDGEPVGSLQHDRVTVDPYEWNEPAIRSWERAGFVDVSRCHPPDEDHMAEWVLMEYRSRR
jgi:hypothetical protein